MPNNKTSLLVVLLIICVGATFRFEGRAQVPASPCTAAELRASQAENRIKGEQALAETWAVRYDILSRDFAQQKGQLSEVGRNLEVEQKNVATLAASNESAQQNISNLKTEVAETVIAKDKVIEERDAALLKIKKANGRFFCEVLSIGCIGER